MHHHIRPEISVAEMCATTGYSKNKLLSLRKMGVIPSRAYENGAGRVTRLVTLRADFDAYWHGKPQQNTIDYQALAKAIVDEMVRRLAQAEPRRLSAV